MSIYLNYFNKLFYYQVLRLPRARKAQGVPGPGASPLPEDGSLRGNSQHHIQRLQECGESDRHHRRGPFGGLSEGQGLRGRVELPEVELF